MLVPATSVQIPARVCEKVGSDLGLAVVFAGFSGLINHLKQASHNFAALWHKNWR